MSARKILELDYKVFTVGDKKFGYGVMETTSPSYAMKRKNELLAEMTLLKDENQLDWIFFSVIDILSEKNTTFVAGPTEEKVLISVFGCNIQDSMADLGNRLSRKKELEPALRKYFETLS
jgi:manganese-dependent inorganic pyrophosphatase